MASHNHLCHQPTTASYCHCYSAYSSCHHHPPPPPPPPDCLPFYSAPPQPHHYSAQTRLPNLQQYHTHFQEPYFQEERQTQHTVSSLLRRIAALEAALRSRSSSSSSSSAFHSLRDAAARTIQTHFRAFLLGRSRTLRQLKDLASIKSRLGLLKSSLSDKTHFDFDVIYHEAVTLLLKLDTVQGGDPMSRDGKRSVTKELNKFLDFLDGFCVERLGHSSRVNARYGGNNVKHGAANTETKPYGGLKTGNMDKLRGLAERIDKLAEEFDDGETEILENPNVFVRKNDVSGSKSRGLLKNLSGVQPKVKKSVTFADNGKVYRVLRRNPVPYIDETDNDNDFEDDLCREVEVIRVARKQAEDDDEVEAHSENGGSLCSSDGEKESRKMYNKDEADNFTFAAPLPLKMETRDDLIEKRVKSAS